MVHVRFHRLVPGFPVVVVGHLARTIHAVYKTSPRQHPFEIVGQKLDSAIAVKQRAGWGPPAANLIAQQRQFNRFREEFNHERPHEALDQNTPAGDYATSTRPMPDKLPPLEYPDRFEIRYVSANGGIRWNHHWVNVSVCCARENVGLKEIDDGVRNVSFGPLKLGRLHERHMRIEDANGRLLRHR